MSNMSITIERSSKDYVSCLSCGSNISVIKITIQSYLKQGTQVALCNKCARDLSILLDSPDKWDRDTDEEHDCTTCKHGWLDERFNVPMCHVNGNCMDWDLWEPKDV